MSERLRTNWVLILESEEIDGWSSSDSVHQQILHPGSVTSDGYPHAAPVTLSRSGIFLSSHHRVIDGYPIDKSCVAEVIARILQEYGRKIKVSDRRMTTREEIMFNVYETLK